MSWSRVSIGDVCRIEAIQVDPKLPQYSPLPHVSAEDIESTAGQLRAVVSAADDGMISGKYLFEPGDVLYSKLRPYLRKVTLAPFQGLCSADMYPLRPLPTLIDGPFLMWLLLSEGFTKYAVRESARARMPKLNRDQLFSWSFLLPPLDEQRRIVTQLTEQMAVVERGRRAAAERVAAVRALFNSIVRESLTGHTRDVSLAGVLIEVKEGVGAAWRDFRVVGATRSGLSAAKEQVGKLPERYKPVVPGTIFYNPMRILIGSIAFLDEGEVLGITSPDYVVVRTRSDQLHPRWFYYWFRSPSGAACIQALARGAVRERLLFRRLTSARISVPTLDAQAGAARRLVAARGSLERAESELAAIKALPAALLREAFGASS